MRRGSLSLALSLSLAACQAHATTPEPEPAARTWVVFRPCGCAEGCALIRERVEDPARE